MQITRTKTGYKLRMSKAEWESMDKQSARKIRTPEQKMLARTGVAAAQGLYYLYFGTSLPKRSLTPFSNYMQIVKERIIEDIVGKLPVLSNFKPILDSTIEAWVRDNKNRAWLVETWKTVTQNSVLGSRKTVLKQGDVNLPTKVATKQLLQNLRKEVSMRGQREGDTLAPAIMGEMANEAIDNLVSSLWSNYLAKLNEKSNNGDRRAQLAYTALQGYSPVSAEFIETGGVSEDVKFGGMKSLYGWPLESGANTTSEAQMESVDNATRQRELAQTGRKYQTLHNFFVKKKPAIDFYKTLLGYEGEATFEEFDNLVKTTGLNIYLAPDKLKQDMQNRLREDLYETTPNRELYVLMDAMAQAVVNQVWT